MDGMSVADWHLRGLAVFVALWTVMMVAMMLPGATPMILIFAYAQARRDRLIAIPTWIFIAGYFVIWAAAGVLVYIVVQSSDGVCRSFCVTRQDDLGPACARSNAGRRRDISVHAAEARMSPPLPLAISFCCSALARGADRRAQYGNASRPLLPRMLLGSFQCVSCGRLLRAQWHQRVRASNVPPEPRMVFCIVFDRCISSRQMRTGPRYRDWGRQRRPLEY